MNDFIHYLNGKFVKEKELLISPRDLGITRGYAVADFIVTHQHQPFELEAHIDRLFNSAEIIGLKIPWRKEQITNWVLETLDMNDKNTEKMIKILLTGGLSHTMYQTGQPTIVIIIDEYKPPPQSYYENGVKVKTIKYQRQSPEAKHTNYVEAIKQLAKTDKNIAEVIYYDDNQVFEGAGSNLFAVIDNKLVTAKTNIVKGITRKVLLEILELSIPIDVRNFTIEELLKATEVFLTGSSKGVRGVVEIDEKPVGNGLVGIITKEASKQYKEYIKL